MPNEISVTECENGYKGFLNVMLVRGVGRKAIHVILRPIHSRKAHIDETQLAIDAAKLAAKKGWRKVVVAPDSYEGDTIRAFNIHQYFHEEWQHGFIGTFLGFVH